MSKEINHHEELQILSDLGVLDDLYLDIASPPFQAFGNDIVSQNPHEHTGEKPTYAFPSASLEILKQCTSKNGKLIRETEKWAVVPHSHPQVATNHIIELAARNFIQLNSIVNYPYGSTLLGHCTEDQNDVRLVRDLLLCAEKVYNQQHDSARKLLEECRGQCSDGVKTIQRLVHSFVEALRDRIDKETGKLSEKDMRVKWLLDFQTPCPVLIALYQKLPLTQITQFASAQSAADHLSGCRKVHIIDLDIRCGVQDTVLMQALASRSDSCPVKHIKITAIANHVSKPMVEEAGDRLKTLADSLCLYFSYHIVMLEDIMDCKKDLFALDYQEAVVVLVGYGLRGMIGKPNQLEMLMRAIKDTNPRAMVVTEIEANVNSPVFVNRFVEALFFYSTYFDYLHDCLENDGEDRIFAEKNILSPAISNIVAAEGDERTMRIVSINVWREFFKRFGMVETDLSKLVLHHANLVRARFDCGGSCTLDLNGKSLIVGWKGVSVRSLSVWKFHGLLSRGKFRI